MRDFLGVLYLEWDDLNDDEKETMTEQYINFREWEEGRGRHETTNDYPDPIDPSGVENCRFYRHPDGYLELHI